MPVAPPRPKGPPLNALRAFEAAARLGGFKRAGEELSVTPAAVAQHVKALEAWAGAPLFERRSQGVALTALGRSVATEFGEAFDALSHALRGLRARAEVRTVQIAALPSVASLWLAPRLPAVRAAMPGVAISVSALEEPPNLNREMFDLTLFFRAPEEGRRIADDWLTPVSTPEIAARLAAPEDVLQETLLFDAEWRGDWRAWLDAAGVTAGGALTGPMFSLYSLALDEARSGAGVLIGHGALVAADLAAGRLVAPFDLRLPSPRPLVLEAAPGAAASPAVRRLAALIEEAGSGGC